MRFGKKGDIHRYQAAEDAFTSEGGYLAIENEALENPADADRQPSRPQPSRNLGKMVKRCAASVGIVMATFHIGGPSQAVRPANPSVP